ncbi:unnamed protein product [Symbiodinium sp. CCMP2592]|nr:unnamed protein product [Symbiodinium sp. CCMP2592]
MTSSESLRPRSWPTMPARDIALLRSTYRRARMHYNLRKKDVAKRCELFHLAAQSIFAGVSEVFQERKRIAGLVLRAVATEKCRHDTREQMEEGFLKRLGRPKLKAPESRRFKAIFDSADSLLLNNFPLAGEAMCKAWYKAAGERKGGAAAEPSREALFCSKEEFAERSQGLGNLLRCQSTLESNIRKGVGTGMTGGWPPVTADCQQSLYTTVDLLLALVITKSVVDRCIRLLYEPTGTYDMLQNSLGQDPRVSLHNKAVVHETSSSRCSGCRFPRMRTRTHIAIRLPSWRPGDVLLHASW